MYFLLTLAALSGVLVQPQPSELDYLVGEYRAEVLFYDRSGQVTRRGASETRTQRIFGGTTIEQTGLLLDAGLEARSFYYIDATTREVTWAALSSILELNVFSGGLEEGGLVLVAEGRLRDGTRVRFKRVDRNVSTAGYELSMYMSTSDDDAWILVNRQFNRRVERGRAAAEALASYAGAWVGEEHRATPEGKGYRFRYVLEPLDPKRTIYEMTILQELDDGGSKLLWKGFKDYDASTDEVWYNGFSPSGRVGRGRVLLVGDELETVYEGRTSDGSVAEIKDVFSVLAEDRFRSVTFMRRDGSEWEKVNEDHWKRASSGER